jgi:hypothetical protein
MGIIRGNIEVLRWGLGVFSATVMENNVLVGML